MFFCSSTPRKLGILVLSDFFTLEALHELIQRVRKSMSEATEASVGQTTLCDDNDILLNLEFDIKKAFSGHYEKQQLTYRVGRRSEKMYVYGTNIFWPEILIQVETLLHRLSYLKYEDNQQWMKRNDISIVYSLHSAIEDLVRVRLPEEAATQVYSELSLIVNHPFEQIFNLLNSRIIYYMNIPPKKRLAMLPELLASFTKPSKLEFTEDENTPSGLTW